MRRFQAPFGNSYQGREEKPVSLPLLSREKQREGIVCPPALPPPELMGQQHASLGLLCTQLSLAYLSPNVLKNWRIVPPTLLAGLLQQRKDGAAKSPCLLRIGPATRRTRSVGWKREAGRRRRPKHLPSVISALVCSLME